MNDADPCWFDAIPRTVTANDNLLFELFLRTIGVLKGMVEVLPDRAFSSSPILTRFPEGSCSTVVNANLVPPDVVVPKSRSVIIDI